MEEFTFKVDFEEKSRKVLIEQLFNTVVVNNIWDSHGQEIAWEDDNDNKQYVYRNAQVLLTEVTRVYHFEYTEDSQFTTWELRINGIEYNGNIINYSKKDNKLILTACIGIG